MHIRTYLLCTGVVCGSPSTNKQLLGFATLHMVQEEKVFLSPTPLPLIPIR